MRAVKGDDAAFTELMDIHKIQLYKMAYSYLRNEDEAEALQEVTFRAYRALKRIKNPDFFSTWLVRILLNYCMTFRKVKNGWSLMQARLNRRLFIRIMKA